MRAKVRKPCTPATVAVSRQAAAPAGPTAFQPSRPAPSSPRQVPHEHAESTGIPKVSTPGKSLPLDQLENTIGATAVVRLRARKRLHCRGGLDGSPNAASSGRPLALDDLLL
jgi:hypothetical protein